MSTEAAVTSVFLLRGGYLIKGSGACITTSPRMMQLVIETEGMSVIDLFKSLITQNNVLFPKNYN